MDTILLVLYKNLNCALDKTIDTGHTTDIKRHEGKVAIFSEMGKTRQKKVENAKKYAKKIRTFFYHF